MIDISWRPIWVRGEPALTIFRVYEDARDGRRGGGVL
jgi:hypothetical protein